jgi:hypothetical protein
MENLAIFKHQTVNLLWKFFFFAKKLEKVFYWSFTTFLIPITRSKIVHTAKSLFSNSHHFYFKSALFCSFVLLIYLKFHLQNSHNFYPFTLTKKYRNKIHPCIFRFCLFALSQKAACSNVPRKSFALCFCSF